MAGWKKGRGLLGPMAPLIGRWRSEAAGPGPASGAQCLREFERFGDGWVRLEAVWSGMGPKTFREIALFGREGDALAFWSFTVDGKRSQGRLAEASDIHTEALAFEAEMPAGLARMVYWPAEDGPGFYFAVESRTKKGWNRFLRHRYRPA